MNVLILFGAASVVLVVIFWVLMILAIIGAILPDNTSPYLSRGRWLIALILFAILGIAALGNPLN
jgi:hypothetical protein